MKLRLLRPVVVAGAATATYGICAVFVAQGGRPSLVACCNLGYYLLLVLNSVFSVSFTETAFRVRKPQDQAIGVLLLVGFGVAPWLVADVLRFYLLMAVFFCLTTYRYASWLEWVDSPFFLRRKVKINAQGVLLCVLLVAASHLGRPAAVAVCGFLLYAWGNLLTLVLDPLYREA